MKYLLIAAVLLLLALAAQPGNELLLGGLIGLAAGVPIALLIAISDRRIRRPYRPAPGQRSPAARREIVIVVEEGRPAQLAAPQEVL